MGFKRRARPVLISLALAGAGSVLLGAWQHAMWGSVVGAGLVVGWLSALQSLAENAPSRLQQNHIATTPDGGNIAQLRLLLDQAPTPLVAVEGTRARALNRAARTLFVTQDCIVPIPLPMLDPTTSRMAHAGRHWRIDRVEARGTSGSQTILMLIDIEAEERSGEARAAAEMIHVMGHEVLNGLAPIVSLAESGLAAWQQPEAQRAQLMPEILTTLARRTESLQRFTEAYRALARLPEPSIFPVPSDEFLGDLTLLFDGQWRDRVALRVQRNQGNFDLCADRDQLTQAVWALLQNAAEAALAGPNERWVGLSITSEVSQTTICVSDSGEGISSAQRERIFHPFHTTKPGGTGIGLSLGRQIARAHGGELHLQASLPTTFVITLPDSAHREHRADG